MSESSPSIPHGTAGGYTNHGCRCNLCKSARNAYLADYRSRKSAQINEYYRKWYEENADRVRARARELSISPERIATKRKYAEENAEHLSEVARAWRQSERGKSLKRAAHARRRALRRGADHGCVSADAIRELLTLPCVYCGAPAEHIDHIHPLDAGGWHCLDNLAPACAPCNLSKGAKVLEDAPEAPLRCDQALTSDLAA